MGFRGPQPKPDAERQRRNKRPQLALAAPRSAMPAAPRGLLKITLERWGAYWSSELAQAVRDAHVPVVDRLFQRYDERERAYRTVRREGRVTKGSQGQVVAHPLLKYIDACDSEIRQLEDRLGLSPKAMAQLALAGSAAQKSLDDVNKSLEQDEDDGHRDEIDPRLSVAG